MEGLTQSELYITMNCFLGFFIVILLFNFIDFLVDKYIKKKPTKSPTTLNCGIWAWAGKDPKKFNKSKFDILGLYNDSRGGQGCGIYKNGDIIKKKSSKLYKDFLININYNNDLAKPIIIGHARKASSGTVSESNTHPFGFGTTKDKEYEFVGVHNGTLYNDYELSEMFKVNSSDIDSQILLNSIYKSKSFKVLEEYIGAAAIVFHNANEPDTIYVFKGESPKYEGSTKTIEERPLFYFQKEKESLYISSIEDSLIAITDSDKELDKIDSFDTNIVYKIKNGNVETATKFKINRSTKFQRESYSGNSWSTGWGQGSSQINQNRNKKSSPKTNVSKKNRHDYLKNNKKFNIFKESYDNESTKNGNIIFNKFKYMRNGHPVTGVLLLESFMNRLTFLDEDFVDAVQIFKDKYYNKFYNFESDKFIQGKLSTDQINYCFKPFTSINNLPFIYVVDGIRVLTKRDFEMAININNRSADNLSYCSNYPVINENKEVIHKGQKVILKRFTPVNSEYIYTIVQGKVVNRKKCNASNLLENLFTSFEILPIGIKERDTSAIFSKKIDLNITLKNKNLSLFDKYLEDLETDEEVNQKPKIYNLPKKPETGFNRDLDISLQRMNSIMGNYLIKKLNSFKKIDHKLSNDSIIAIEKFLKSIKEISEESKKIKNEK